jgi:hypothetical protein
MSTELTYNEFMNNLVGQIKGQTTVSDIKHILIGLLSRNKIDMLSKINEYELDKICSMLHHSHQQSVLMNYRLKLKGKDRIMISPHRYVLQNLCLRLSVDGHTWTHFTQIFTGLINRDVMHKEEELKKLQTQQNLNPEAQLPPRL